MDNYEKKYNEALEKARQLCAYPTTKSFISDLQDLFPELKESEDEKIKKRITLCLEECVHSDVIRDYEKDECIAWLEKQGQVKESTISQHENRTCEENNNSLTHEDERIRKEIINYFQCQSEEEPTRKEIHNKWIAWLENIPYTIDHEKREGFHLGYRACLERLEMKSVEESLGIDSDTYNKIVDECIFGKQKPKGNIGGISPNWSEEDEENFRSVYLDVKSARQNTVNSLSGELKEQEQKRMDEVISWLKSLKSRVQPKQEWSEEEIEPIISDYLCGREHYGGMIGRLCHLKPKQKQTEWGEDDKAFLDDILCKLEHDLVLNKDEKDWLKSLRPQSKQEWSEEDEQHIDSLLKRLDALCRNKFERTRFAISEDRDWLKSLRPHDRWKPSELQLGCLSDAIEYYNSFGYPAPKLKELLDDLKKLKEGKV